MKSKHQNKSLSEISVEIHNKLQAGKTALEALRDGKKVPKELIEIALKDMDKVIKLIN